MTKLLDEKAYSIARRVFPVPFAFGTFAYIISRRGMELMLDAYMSNRSIRSTLVNPKAQSLEYWFQLVRKGSAVAVADMHIYLFLSFSLSALHHHHSFQACMRRSLRSSRLGPGTRRCTLGQRIAIICPLHPSRTQRCSRLPSTCFTSGHVTTRVPRRRLD